MAISRFTKRPLLVGLAAGAVLLSGCSFGASAEPTTAIVTTTESPSTTAIACSNAKILAGWPTSALSASLIIVPVNDANPQQAAPEVSSGAGGVILFGSQATSALGGQLASLDRVNPLGVPPLIMSDEEGGAVQRLGGLLGAMPSARTMGATLTPSQIQSLAYSYGTKLLAVGVTMDLAPVLDVDGRPGPSATNPDGTRSFSAIPSVAAADGVAFAEGLKEAGVIPVLKHFPGLGGSSGNTDVAPASTLPFSELKTTGLIPFEAAIAANLPVVMVSNATVPGLTSQPASLSSVAIDYLRNSLGFKGLVITDSLSAGAIQQTGLTVPEATVRAIEAGADMIMYNTLNPITTFKASVVALDQAVSTGSLSRTRLISSVEKILKTRNMDLCAN
ncbi:MAG: hypothetical protein HKL81_09360 [Acidimicrobiaceae bacterium]|nr:hypothetical protein [Acidimicrobiaceae bacterium]